MEQVAQPVNLAHITTVPMSLAFIRGQIRYMQRRGFGIHAISSPGDALATFGEQEQVKTYSVEMPRKITPIHDLGAVARLIRTLRKIHPTIVHAHTPKGGLLGMISAWLNRTPVRIYSILGFPYMTASGRKRSLLKWTERIACLLSHEVFCVSHSLRQVAIQDGICPPHKIRVLRGGSVNGVDTSDRFNPSRFGKGHRCMARKRLGIDDKDFAIGFVGRIVRDKGIAELASAWTSIRESHPAAHLVMVGPVEPQDPVDPETLKMLRNDARVHLAGSIDDTSMMYVAFDLVVLPTYREGFPNVPLEAAAMELPVVATCIPGCVDAVQDGVTGTLVPPRDAEALRIAIERYLDDPELREQHGKAGRERVLREFRQEDIWEAIYQEYTRLLREKGIAVPPASEEGQAVRT